MSKRNDIVVLKTAMLHEADMAANALKEAEIPFYRRQLSSAGVEFAMPVAAVPGPGTFWLILVPPSAEADARELIRDLPISQDENPGVWDLAANPRIKPIWQLVARFMIFCFFLSFGYQAIQAVMAWFNLI